MKKPQMTKAELNSLARLAAMAGKAALQKKKQAQADAIRAAFPSKKASVDPEGEKK